MQIDPSDEGTQAPEAGAGQAVLRSPLLGARLFTLMRLIRESGVPLYEREIGYREIHRHLIMILGISQGLSSQEIVAVTGHEKAQISRTVKVLEQEGLVGRESLRGQLKLLPPGQAIFRRIVEISSARDASIAEGIDPDDLRRFIAATEELTLQAAEIFAQERRLSAEAGIINACSPASSASVWPRGADGQSIKPPQNLVTPGLVGLATYLRRGGMLACQRMHGLSHFQWQTLLFVGMNGTLPLAQLIAMLGRDKSQVGRTVVHLEQAGLVERSRPTRRRDILLTLTETGMVVFRSMHDFAVRREDALWQAVSADRGFFLDMVDKLIVRAREMLPDA